MFLVWSTLLHIYTLICCYLYAYRVDNNNTTTNQPKLLPLLLTSHNTLHAIAKAQGRAANAVVPHIA